MSKIVRIPEDHLILVCNARKAILLKNAGHVAQPDLQVEAHVEFEWDREEMMDSDRPGRRFDGNANSGGPRSAMEAPDPDAKHAEEVAEKIVETLADRNRTSEIGGLLVVAPPAFLGVLRQKIGSDLRRHIVAEVAKDLVEMPVRDIQKSLMKVL